MKLQYNIKSFLLAGFYACSVHYSCSAQEVDPSSFKIAGITSGLTIQQTLEVIKKRNPNFQTRYVTSKINGQDKIIGLVAEIDSERFVQDAIIAMATVNDGRVYEVLHEQRFIPGHEVTAENLKAAIHSQYGLSKVIEITGVTAYANFLPIGTLDPSGQCTDGANFDSPIARNTDGLLRQQMLVPMHITNNPMEGCGMSIKIAGYPDERSPGIINVVTQQFIDQEVLAKDIKTTEAQQADAVMKANAAAVQSRKDNPSGL